MTKVLIIGEGPLPWQKSAKRTAAGLRMAQFMRSAIAAGHEVRAVLFSRLDFWENGKLPKEKNAVYLERDEKGYRGKLKKIVREFKPEAVVAVNALAAERVAELKLTVPFWADVNGSPSMEAETQAGRLGGDEMLPFFWQREKKILEVADVISTCSKRQEAATLGMLVGLGRMNSKNFGKRLVYAIPNLTEEWKETDRVQGKASYLRGKVVPKEAFVVSMVGGWWNAWLDEETLFYALEDAMRKNSAVHFVAGGGAVPGLTLKPLDNFRGLIKTSKFAERFHLLGWLPTSEMARVYREVDVCISLDRLCADTLTGARNRLTEWAKFGLPMIVTEEVEVAEELIAVGAAEGVRIGDRAGASKAILSLAKDKKKQAELGKRAKEYCKREWNYATGMREFTEWLKRPSKAGDKGRRVKMSGGFWQTRVKAGWRYYREVGLKRTLRKVWERLF